MVERRQRSHGPQSRNPEHAGWELLPVTQDRASAWRRGPRRRAKEKGEEVAAPGR